MADTARSATVELLTAEVRVLQVGSRQVTLSVARQLDCVDLSQAELFGRVRLRDSDAVAIGKHRIDGSLVTAHLGRFDICSGDAYVVVDEEESRWCRFHSDPDFGLPPSWIALCYRHHYSSHARCADWDADNIQATLKILRAWASKQTAYRRELAQLPLIVLAGLR